MLNSSIRARNGNNNNPNVLQFKSAMKKVLLRASVTASRYSNCMSFDPDTSPPIFSLKWSKNRSCLTQEDDDIHADLDLSFLDSPFVMSQPLVNMLVYLGGYIIRRCLENCLIGAFVLLSPDKPFRISFLLPHPATNYPCFNRKTNSCFLAAGHSYKLR